MKLHRAGNRPDWAFVKPTEQSRAQRLAATTKGLLTPGNAASVIGLLLVFLGVGLLVAEHYWAGFLAVAVGRFCDVLDGMLAARTRTKSPLGEALDAAVDKVEIFGALAVFMVVGIIPWIVVLGLALPNLANAWLTGMAAQRRVRLHPSARGKLATAWAWAALLFFILEAAWAQGAGWFVWLAYASTVVAVGLGFVSTIGYARSLRSG